jgi:hypothetical protein
MTSNKDVKNPWTYEDDLEHYPCIIEWWAFIFFFKTIENNKKWASKSAFVQWHEKSNEIGSMFNFSIFDENEGKNYGSYSKKYDRKLDSVKGKLEVHYNDCFLKGSYPNYEIFANDKENNIKLNIKYKAISLPHWVGQDVTNGWLPMGTGFYRYGFVPINKVTGTMEIKNKTYQIEGKGYLEHVWGDIWYDNPFSNITSLRRTISIYVKFLKWWLQNHKIKIPSSIQFATESNPFGYDWSWALFDNGWTMFYGNILSWIMEGPVTGILIISKDGKNYKEFGNITFKYIKTQYSKKYDFVYPTEYEIKAKNEKESLYLKFKMTNEAREYLSKFSKGKYFIGFIICEAPGKVEGYYSDGKIKVKLKGIAKIEPQRQISIIGHNTLKIDFLKPPSGIGITFDLDSHYFKKRIFTQIQLAPYPKLNMTLKKIEDYNKNLNKKSSLN